MTETQRLVIGGMNWPTLNLWAIHSSGVWVALFLGSKMVTAVRYFKYPDDESLIGGTTYAELRDGVYIRQITVNGVDVIASNFKHPKWSICLAEGKVDIEELLKPPEWIHSITKQEFDDIWNAHLVRRQTIWDQVKQVYPVGLNVQGAILIFFPQGAIVDLGGDAIGVADYNACRASTKPEFMYTRHKITAVVKDYDEVNQWVILDSPHVYAERIE